MVEQHPGNTRRAGRFGSLLRFLGVVVLIAAMHGQSVRYGLFMDDWAHIRQLREAGWSLRELTDACRLELVGGIAELWWMPECTLRFFRPVSFGLMKLTYTLVGWDVAAMHVASLAWHLLVCVLLAALLRRLGAGPGAAWLIAALFAIHPGHVGTVQWIACQTELMVTAFLLGGTLCYLEGMKERGAKPKAAEAGPSMRSVDGTKTGSGALWFGGTITLFVLALGCRENAILFPGVLAALLVGRKQCRGTGTPEHTASRAGDDPSRDRIWREWWLYVVLIAVAGAYLAVRGAYLGGVAIPPRPYVFPPDAPGFERFVLDKLCYNLIGEFFLVPCVPIGGLPYFRAHAPGFYSMAIAVGVLLLLCMWHGWRRSPGWLGPAWLVLFFAPTLPAFSSPHHLYLPGVGWAIVLWQVTQMFGRRANTPPVDGLRLGAEPVCTRVVPTPRFIVLLLVAFGLVCGVFTHLSGLMFDAGQQVEDALVAEVAGAPRGLRDGDTLYIANMPIIGHYLRLALEEQTGRRHLRVVPLTWAPRVLGLLGSTAQCELQWVDERIADIRIRGDRYFAGSFGLLVKEAFGRWPPVDADRPVRTRDFEVQLLESDLEGVLGLRFVFERAPARDGAHFFWGSRARWAYEVEPP